MTATTAPRPTTRRPVDLALIGFFVAAYLLPWTVWCSRIAYDHGLIGWHLPGGIALWTLVPVTVTAVALTGGPGGPGDLGRRIGRGRVPVRWYAAAAGIPLAVAVAATGIGAAVSGAAHLGETL